ncbi:CATION TRANSPORTING ATPASE [Salix purpurea]|uniref:P-type Cu(+) transporter n=1 Tax=Salix purpurea TaxID=77065 RepID=A0A9Q0T8N5_SALPP|nr:CATION TRANSPORTING ATPASE [Salix purpurea]
MEHYLKENFAVDAKSPSEEALRRWRSAVAVVRNPRRRFRMVADLAKRAEAERKRKNIQEKIRIALYINKAAFQFIEAANRVEHRILDSVRRQTGFDIGPDELAALARSHDINYLESHGGVEGLGRQVSVSLNDGVVSSDISIRQNLYGFNRYAEKPARSFWMFVWDALHDLTLVILMVCAVVSIGVGIATDGWPDGMYDGVGIVMCILLVVMVTAITDYKQALQFKVLDKEKKNVIVQTNSNKDLLMSSFSENVHGILLQSIFQNTGSEVTKGKDGTTDILGTPTETAMLELGLLLGGDFKTHHNESGIVKVEPFNSEKKKMSVLVSLPDNGRFRALCKGASEIILKMCDKMLTADGKAVPLSEKKRQKITDVIDGFSCEALRTLCLAFKDMENTSGAISMPDNSYTLIAVVGIKDPIRPEVKEAVKTCLDAGITVRMVTGDNINTAKAIARECGILTDYGLVIEGADFRCKSPQELEEIIPKLQVMARSSPSDKHKLVTQLRSVFKEVVAVTGDGTNDAPALAEADIGLAMGIAGTEHFNISYKFITKYSARVQVFNEINSRDMEKINVFKGIFSSWVFLTVMFSTVTFQIVIVEFLGTYANTVPLRWELWLASVLIGAASLVIAVILKCIPVERNKDDSTVKHHDGYEPLPSGPRYGLRIYDG